MEGNIIVDDILASCYASIPNHDWAHIGMTPNHWFPEVTELIFGHDNVSPLFIEIAKFVGRMILPIKQNLELD